MDSDNGRGSDTEQVAARKKKERSRRSKPRDEQRDNGEETRQDTREDREERRERKERSHRERREANGEEGIRVGGRGEETREEREARRERKERQRRDEREPTVNDDDIYTRPTSRDVKQDRQTDKQPPRKDGDVMLWDLAIKLNQQSQQSAAAGQLEEKSILFVGSKDAGKTTVIFRFLDRDEAPKPTTALEYTFGRRSKGNNLDKDVAHIWELGGGTWLAKLADVAIGPDSIKTLSLALVLDLSRPNELWGTLERWLGAVRARIDAVLAGMRDSNPSARDDMRRLAFQRYGPDHQDLEMLDPLLLPVVILATKYDIFQDFDGEKRKVICKTLRFVAHRYGAHLQFFSYKNEALLNKTRAIISNLVFDTALGKVAQTDHNKPLMVSVGQDSLQQIGGPPLAEGDLGRVTAKTPMDLWKHAFATHFPPENADDPSMVDDPSKDRQFAEPAVDAMRAQKDEELERYRKASERRAKESFAGQALVEGYA